MEMVMNSLKNQKSFLPVLQKENIFDFISVALEAIEQNLKSMTIE
jgi:hypothetical protein